MLRQVLENITHPWAISLWCSLLAGFFIVGIAYGSKKHLKPKEEIIMNTMFILTGATFWLGVLAFVLKKYLERHDAAAQAQRQRPTGLQRHDAAAAQRQQPARLQRQDKAPFHPIDRSKYQKGFAPGDQQTKMNLPRTEPSTSNHDVGVVEKRPSSSRSGSGSLSRPPSSSGSSPKNHHMMGPHDEMTQALANESRTRARNLADRFNQYKSKAGVTTASTEQRDRLRTALFDAYHNVLQDGTRDAYRGRMAEQFSKKVDIKALGMLGELKRKKELERSSTRAKKAAARVVSRITSLGK